MKNIIIYAVIPLMDVSARSIGSVFQKCKYYNTLREALATQQELNLAGKGEIEFIIRPIEVIYREVNA